MRNDTRRRRGDGKLIGGCNWRDHSDRRHATLAHQRQVELAHASDVQEELSQLHLKAETVPALMGEEPAVTCVWLETVTPGLGTVCSDGNTHVQAFCTLPQ